MRGHLHLRERSKKLAPERSQGIAGASGLPSTATAIARIQPFNDNDDIARTPQAIASVCRAREHGIVSGAPARLRHIIVLPLAV